MGGPNVMKAGTSPNAYATTSMETTLARQRLNSVQVLGSSFRTNHSPNATTKRHALTPRSTEGNTGPKPCKEREGHHQNECDHGRISHFCPWHSADGHWLVYASARKVAIGV